ncbi:hypothetical protein D3C76_405110 [compost metagenome]|uniref:hypothetical protein n=1 Tax=Paenibacillus TaxID=44249 RepID=UPI000FBC3E8E|nr:MULTISPECIES: hypothetical protein [Paenibacillus]MUG88428.1 hypothetical protein [Paenibacillus timonensis]GIP50794.1 hypothetical protein J53TS2_43850 [Paenibacillus sp. J53TS2]
MMTAPSVSLPQPYALRLETIRAKGMEENAALELLERNSAAEWQERINPELQWDGFAEYVREHVEEVKQAYLEGYRFKFMTVGGLRSLLQIKFGLQAGQDYVYDENNHGFSGVKLKEADYRSLRMLSPDYWEIRIDQKDSDRGLLELRIEHKYGD